MLIQSRFLKSESGSLVPIFGIALVPLLLAVGLSVDYTSATTTRSNMQNALDAATLSIVTLPTTTSEADRQTALQAAFESNGGKGTAKLESFTLAADGTADVKASARYDMPTDFMQIAMIKDVPIGIQSSVNKTPSLVEATFNVNHVSGYWGKTMYLYGTEFGSSTAKKLMKIDYTYKAYSYSYDEGSGSRKKTYTATDPKGYGTTTISTVSGTTEKLVQTQVCSTAGSKSDFTPNSTTFRTTSVAKNGNNSGSTIYFKTTCATTNAAGNTTGAKIDVSTMDTLYLQMDVPSGPVKTLKSNDPTTSNRLYIGTPDVQNNLPIEIPQGKIVDIFSAVPCSQTSDQAWEDGGNNPPSPDVSNADFFYSVTGKCDFSKRPSETVLTQ